MKKLFFTLIAFTALATTFADAQTTVSHSAITFKIKNLGINTNGIINGLKADIHFNPADPASGSIMATVDVNTLSTDNSSRDEHLRSEDYFDVARYPKITLKSVSLKHKSGNNFTGQFNLTIKDKTKLIEIPFTCTQKNGSLAFNGIFKINRRDYGVGGNSMILSDEVNVVIDVSVAN